MAQVYCGNNIAYTGLVNGTHRMGTNLECLRIGIGKGKSLPADPNFAEEYRPFDTRTYYCGGEDEIPANSGHFAMGSPSKCLAVGIGVGKKQKADETFNQGGNSRRSNFGIVNKDSYQNDEIVKENIDNETENQNNDNDHNLLKRNQTIYYLVLVFIFLMVFIILYTLKPSFVCADILEILERETKVKNGVLIDDEEINNEEIIQKYKHLSPVVIDWYNFTIYFLGISLLLGLIFSIVWKKYIIERIDTN
jgi:hypothetical protein